MKTPILLDPCRTRAQLQPAPLTAVTLKDEIWAARRARNLDVTLPSQYRLLEETGRIDNFRRAAGREALPFRGRVYNDSDVYKWLEAASWMLATDEAPALAEMVATVVAAIEGAQAADGSLNTYYTFERADDRWANLRDHHELYCAGHLIQAAIAHHRATGEDRLLNVARRFADLICDTFGKQGEANGQRPGAPGHPEIEMALIELARLTGESRYREQAAYFLNARGRGLLGGRAYYVDHVPFREMTRLAGHAVRALYLCAGAADLYTETGEAALRETLDRLWEMMVARQMYITGGVGSRHSGESFGAPFELPNARAYAETCAGIGVVMWAWRMLQLGGDPRYADVMERALYNAVLPGISLDGEHYFYDNPLAVPPENATSARRRDWFICACCPTNIARLLAMIPGYIYSVEEAGVWVHLYAANAAQLTLPDGREIALIQRTRYPWSGQITVEVLSAGEFSLWMRVPGWSDDDVALTVNGLPWEGPVTPGTYVQIHRAWQPGDAVCLHLPMDVHRMAAHPYALKNTGRVALMRGPVLYCLEQVDHPADVDLRDVTLTPATKFSPAFEPSLLGGVQVLRASAETTPPAPAWANRLYRPKSVGKGTSAGQAVDLMAVPYIAWANRAPGAMQVWLKMKDE